MGYSEEHEKGIRFLCKISRLGTDRRKLEWTIESLFTGSQLDFGAFFALPYFSRRWIIPEIAVNCDVTLYCGASSISWTRFIIALEILKECKIESIDSALLSTKRISHNTLTKLSHLWRLHCGAISNLESKRTGDDRSTFLALLDDFETSECTDPRDRLYALYRLATDQPVATALGKCRDTCECDLFVCQAWDIFKMPRFNVRLSNGKLEFQLVIDYDAPVDFIYEHYAVSALRSPCILPILSAATLRRGTPRPQNLPSWVPDWRIKKEQKTPNSLMSINGAERVRTMKDGKITIDVEVLAFGTTPIPTIRKAFPFRDALREDIAEQHHVSQTYDVFVEKGQEVSNV